MTRADQMQKAEELLSKVTPPRFANPQHKAALLQQLQSAPQTEPTRGLLTLLVGSIQRHRYLWGTLTSAAAATAALCAIVLTNPTSVFAKALSEMERYPVVHYVMRKRAMANQWGPIIDPRQPLRANDEVWAHRGRGDIASEIRYETGKQVGDHQILLIKNGELLFFIPQGKLAFRYRGTPRGALRIGPISILERAAALDPSTYQVSRKNGAITATARLKAEPIDDAKRTVPILLEEFERTEHFVFDAKSGQLRSIKVEGLWQGRLITLVEIDEIEHQAYDPKRFELALPPDVSWAEEPRLIKGTALEGKVESTPEGAARAFFQAWVKGEKETMRIYAPHYVQKLTAVRAEGYFPVKVLSIGKVEAPTDGIYPGVFVPYVLQMKDGSIRKHRIALKRTRDGITWRVDGGI